MGQTPEEIRNDIEVTRAELRDDVDRIAQRASPRGWCGGASTSSAAHSALSRSG